MIYLNNNYLRCKKNYFYLHHKNENFLVPLWHNVGNMFSLFIINMTFINGPICQIMNLMLDVSHGGN